MASTLRLDVDDLERGFEVAHAGPGLAAGAELATFVAQRLGVRRLGDRALAGDGAVELALQHAAVRGVLGRGRGGKRCRGDEAGGRGRENQATDLHGMGPFRLSSHAVITTEGEPLLDRADWIGVWG